MASTGGRIAVPKGVLRLPVVKSVPKPHVKRVAAPHIKAARSPRIPLVLAPAARKKALAHPKQFEAAQVAKLNATAKRLAAAKAKRESPEARVKAYLKAGGEDGKDFKIVGKRGKNYVVEYTVPKRFQPDSHRRREVTTRGNVIQHHGSIGEAISGGVSDAFRETGEALKAVTPKPLRKPIKRGATAVLEEVSKPRYAVGGVLSGHTPGYGIRHRTNPGSVIKRHLPKGLKTVGAIAGDIFLDPTTYAGVGLVGRAVKAAQAEGAAVRVAAEKAAQAYAKEAAAKGVGEREIAANVERMVKEGHVKARAHTIDAQGARGVKVTFAGKRLPGITPATAGANVGIRRAAGAAAKLPGVSTRIAPKLRSSKAALRDTVAAVRPQIRTASDVAAGTTRGLHYAGRVHAAVKRTAESGALHEADLLMQGLKKRVTAPEWEAIIAARETGTLDSLPAHLQETGHELAAKLDDLGLTRDIAHIKEGRITARPKPPVAAAARDAYKLGARSKRTARGVRAARTAVAAAERKVKQAEARLGVAQGRSEILSRNVGGRAAENKAAKVRQPQRAGGQYGHDLATRVLTSAKAELKAATDRLEIATGHHTEAKAAAKDARLGANATRREAARRDGEAVGYFPHIPHGRLTERYHLSEPEYLTPENVKFPTGKTVSGSKRRKHLAPIHEQPEMGFSRDVPLVMHAYASDTGKRAAASEFFQGLHSLGRKVTDHAEVRPGEAVYRLGHDGTRYGLHEIKPGEPIAAGADTVALPRAFVDRSTISSKATFDTGRWDKATGTWKSIATATPGFHLRNLFGDTWMWHSMREGGIRSAPAELKAAWKGIRALAHSEAGLRNGEAFDLLHLPRGTNVRIAGQDMDVADFVQMAHQYGVLRTGHIGGELRDVLRSMQHTGGVRGGLSTASQFFRRFGQNREDLLRLASFKNGLDQGEHAALAAQRARDVHFDYRELTNFEREFKRYLAPFYTFTGRSIPQQTTRLVTRPGKFANLEAIREEVASAFGMTPDEMDAGLTEFQNKAIPFRVHIAGDRAVAFDLPAQALNLVPTSGENVGAALRTWLDTSTQLLHPAPKAAIEQTTHTTLFNLSPMKAKVDAPSWIGHAPAWMKDALGVEPKFDQVTHKQIGYVWSGRTQEAVGAGIPGGPGAALRATTPGGSTGETALSTGLGVRAKKVDPAAAEGGAMGHLRRQLDAQIEALNERGLYHSPEWMQLDYARKKLKFQQAQSYAAQNGGAPSGAWWEHDDSPAQAAPAAPSGAWWEHDQ